MKTRRSMLVTMMACTASLVFVGCQKETPALSTSEQSAQVTGQNASIEAAFADAFMQVDVAAKTSGLKNIGSACPTLSFSPNDLTTYPKDMVIAYGSACAGVGGVVRSGNIMAHLSAPYSTTGSVTTITFDEYHVNGRLITGTEVITNVGPNAANNLVFNVEIQNGNLFSIDGVTVYNSTQQREWIEGSNTLLNILDDVYLVTGTANGITTGNINYSLEITTELLASVDCAWIQSGVVEITEPNIPVIIIDYGNGTCDNSAVATCAGYTFNIVMP